MPSRPSSERKLLIIGTGGTIASEPTDKGFSPVRPLFYPTHPDTLFPRPIADSQLRTTSFYRRIRHHPQLSDLSHLTPFPGQSGSTSPVLPSPPGAALGSGSGTGSGLTFDSEPFSVQVGNNTLYPELRTPKLCGLGAVRYEILDLDRHMDSSEMTPTGEFEFILFLFLGPRPQSLSI
jgi:lysophospholipase